MKTLTRNFTAFTGYYKYISQYFFYLKLFTVSQLKSKTNLKDMKNILKNALLFSL